MLEDNGVLVIEQVIRRMRTAFVDNEPYGGRLPRIEHRGGLLVPIDAGLDSDGDCNAQGWVNLLRRWRTTQFPAEDAGVTPCGGVPAILVQAGVARCSQAMTDEGEPPPPEVMEREALALMDDAVRLERVMCGATVSADKAGLIHSAVVHAWEPIGPDGGILSGVITASFQLTDYTD